MTEVIWQIGKWLTAIALSLGAILVPSADAAIAMVLTAIFLAFMR